MIKNINKLLKKKKVTIWDLAGAMKSDIKATDEQLQEARNDFEKHWAREM